MGAYASLLSLGHILERILQHPPHHMDVLDNVQIDSLLENITFLQEFLEDFSLIRGDEIQGLEKKIARSAYAAEHIIESRVVDLILEDSEAGSSTLFYQDLQKVIGEFDSMKKDVMKIEKPEMIKIMEPRKVVNVGSFIRGASDSKNTMVGFDKDLIQIMERLIGDESNFQIHSIVGMGGIGKTTLAKNVFDNPLIGQHFDLRAWVTISQQHSVHEILSGLLKDIRVLAGEGEETQKIDDELGLRLHKSLFDRRYFIVMDDMWSIEVWDGIKRFFPDNDNGSRVMITTRLTNVADDFHSCTPHNLHFLDKDRSWDLFCDKVFGKERCPPELEESGKKIVINCRGLPLAIVAISGLLAKSSRTVEYWVYVANNTNATLNMGGDGLCLEILSLSYKHLPIHLKPCFLYMARFSEDSRIRISRLVKQWVAEGILKPIRSRSLEEVAKDNLKDLIDRNLIQVHDYGSRNKIKTCTIHDLLRDLCLMEAQKEKFRALNNHSRVIDNHRRLVIQRSSEKEELKSTFAKLHRLQRVLNMGSIRTHEEIVVLVSSRYIDYHTRSYSDMSDILKSLSLLWNLQTVTIADDLKVSPRNLPAEIWEMSQLRHLKLEGDFNLPDPPTTNSKNGRRDNFVLKNLQTLNKIMNFRCTDEVVGSVPNLKKLGITYWKFPSGIGWDYYEVYNLSHLRNLESLFLESVLPKNLCFPQSLKKLTLKNCRMRWEDLTVVGSLPHLEALKLRGRYNVEGREWSPVEGQFAELKSLRIESTDLVEWIADSSHFPHLEKLELRDLICLKEIPEGIGEIPTLRSISLEDCCGSANSSAKKIQEEQQSLGNSDLQVRLRNPRAVRIGLTTYQAALLFAGTVQL